MPDPNWLTPEFKTWLRAVVAENVWRCQETPKDAAHPEGQAASDGTCGRVRDRWRGDRSRGRWRDRSPGHSRTR